MGRASTAKRDPFFFGSKTLAAPVEPEHRVVDQLFVLVARAERGLLPALALHRAPQVVPELLLNPEVPEGHESWAPNDE